MYLTASEVLTGHWYCGAGGDADGIDQIPGTRVRVAANHDQQAIDTHEANFPDALHKRGDIRKLDLKKMPPVHLFIATPECPHWGHAQGVEQTFAKQQALFNLDGDDGEEEDPKAQKAERSRALVWNVLHYLDAMRLRGFTVLAGFVENVPDICKWVHFQAYRNEFHKRGYKTKVIALNSMHAHGPRSPLAPQSRDRFYLAYWHESLGRDPDWDKWLRPAAWCENCEQQVNAMQVFKKPGVFMGEYRRQYVYRCPHVTCRGQAVEPAALPALAILDWNDLGTRLGDKPSRKFVDRGTGEVSWGPLAPKTIARLEAGLRRHARPITLAVFGQTFERRPGVRTWPADRPLVTQTATSSLGMACPPFITVHRGDDLRTRETGEPLPTQTSTSNAFGLACPPLMVPAGGTWNDDATPATGPMRARTTSESEGLAFPPAVLLPLRSGRNRSIPVTDQLATVVANGSNHLLASLGGAMIMRNNTARGDGGQMCTSVEEVLRTLTTAGHQSLVSWPQVLVPYNGTGVARSVLDPTGALPTHDRYALATGELPFDIDDVWFRMLKVAEIQAAMAFRPGYIILGTSAKVRVRQLGNAVTPPAAEVIGSALMEAITGEPLQTRMELAA